MFEGNRVSAIITAAGRGTRFGGNKLLAEIDGMTVLERTVRCFDNPPVDQIVVVASGDEMDTYRQILDDAGLEVEMVEGDRHRHLSARNGLDACDGDIVIVHDGVRPFVTPAMIQSVVAAAVDSGAAMLGVPSSVQIKLVDDSGFVSGSLDRSRSWHGQTPQAFHRPLLEKAYEIAIAQDYDVVSDDADIVATFTDQQVKIVKGRPSNIKITNPQDLATARMIARHEIDEEE
jgi:2-C-methyl-D-erythritol 4-phosphate cytidylyltransferase